MSRTRKDRVVIGLKLSGDHISIDIYYILDKLRDNFNVHLSSQTLVSINGNNYRKYLVALVHGDNLRLGNWERIDTEYNDSILANNLYDFIEKVNYYFKSFKINKDGNNQNQLQGKEVPKQSRESGGRAVRGRIENPVTVRHSGIKKRIITSKG